MTLTPEWPFVFVFSLYTHPHTHGNDNSQYSFDLINDGNVLHAENNQF